MPLAVTVSPSYGSRLKQAKPLGQLLVLSFQNTWPMQMLRKIPSALNYSKYSEYLRQITRTDLQLDRTLRAERRRPQLHKGAHITGDRGRGSGERHVATVKSLQVPGTPLSSYSPLSSNSNPDPAT